MELEFDQTWTIDTNDVVGEGGFGRVYGATNASGELAVAKFVTKESGVDRDLLLSGFPVSPHLIPILDSGEAGDNHILIMPRADRSLRDEIDNYAPLPLEKVVAILDDIAAGLEAISSVVVHRDLKPANVLLWRGSWAITDFGIARYVEATTAADTRKQFLSATHAAPEQWKAIRATPATDIYALGVIAHQLITGSTPFLASSREEFRELHLTATPPELATSKRLAALVDECLYKEPGARPGASNIRARLRRVLAESQSAGAKSLVDAQHRVVQDRAETARREELIQTEAARRSGLFDVASRQFDAIIGELFEVIREHAEAATVRGREIRLGSGSIEHSGCTPVDANPWRGRSPSRPLDVVAFASLEVRQKLQTSGVEYYGDPYTGRSHSLYFCDYDTPGQYGWYEIAFMFTFGNGARDVAPFSLPPGEESGDALSNVMTSVQAARPWTRVAPADADDFMERWMEYLGRAAQGVLQYPQSLPER